ncbi:MAG: hypothetical protein M3O25_02925 [Actinomycetota bacterium]|nr:hypothetical protein [Actinomycetota bacterium]
MIELECDRIQFTHPLLASGIYGAAGSDARRALHRRLAELLPDPEERAHHLALGAESPDPDVAKALEEAAHRAHARGALTAAAELSEQALRLTPVGSEQWLHRRTIRAAGYAMETGESDRARELLEDARDAAPPGPRRAEILYWLGTVEEYHGNRRRAVDLHRGSHPSRR